MFLLALRFSVPDVRLATGVILQTAILQKAQRAHRYRSA